MNCKRLTSKSISLYFLIILFSSLSGTVAAQPLITGITPSSAPAGSVVTINGSGFSSTASNSIVFFGGMRASVSTASVNSLSVVVPQGLTAGAVTVTTNNLTAYSNFPFYPAFVGGSGPFTIGSFEPVVKLPTSLTPNGIQVADFNNDNKPELLYVSSVLNSITVLSNTGTGNSINFSTSQDFPAANYPRWTTIGDVDGDGLLDIVVGNTVSNSISIFRNTSTSGLISFATKIDYSLPSYPNSLSLGELDGDGKPDLVAATGSNGVAVFRNTSVPGNISFATPMYVLTNGTSGTAIADINNDGKSDVIACSQQSGIVSILPNTGSVGTISFAAAVMYTSDINPLAVSVADLDADGKPDIGVANYGSHSVSVFKNSGSGNTVSFGARQDFQTGNFGNPTSLSMTDMDGDAKPEIITSSYNASNSISVLKNTSVTGTISFAPAFNYANARDPWNLVIGDVNVDGLPDIITTSSDDKLVSININKISHAPAITTFTPGAGGETTIVEIKGSNLAGTTAVSFGGQTASSFIVVSDTLVQAIVSTGTSGAISITTPAGIASMNGFIFNPRPSISSFSPASGPIGTQLTITGTNFSSNPTDNIVYFGGVKAAVNAASSTSLTVTVPQGALYVPLSVTTGNLTAWAKEPFRVTFPGGVLSDSSFQIKFASKVADQNGNSVIYSMAMGDMDGDGRNDIIYGDGVADIVSIFRNTTLGDSISFAPRVNFPMNSNFWVHVSIVDMDGDGRLDLAVALEDQNILKFFRNTSVPGTISFATPLSLYCSSYPDYFSIGDLDGDGRADLVINTNSSKYVTVYRNTSTIAGISFATPKTYNLPDYSANTCVGDLDGDGKLDIVAVCQDSAFSIFRNTSVIGSISLAARQDFNTGNSAQEFMIAGKRSTFAGIDDLDGDGRPEVLISKYQGGTGIGQIVPDSDTISIYKNQSIPGNIILDAKIDVPTSYAAGKFRTADVNGDGKSDLVATDGRNYISVLKNTSTSDKISFAPRFDYRAYYNPHDVAVGDLNGDGKPELAAIADGLGYLYVFTNYNRPTTLLKEFILLDTLVKLPCNRLDLYWRTENESNTMQFLIQRNIGSGFYSVDSIPSAGNNSGGRDYHYTYTITDNVKATYRVRLIGLNGEVLNSNSIYRTSGQPSPPSISPNGVNSICQGSGLTLTSSAVSYNQWYKDGVEVNGATNSSYVATAAGSYQVKTNDPVCSTALSNSVSVIIKPSPAQPLITQIGNILQSSAASGNQWYFNGNAIAGATSNSYTALNSGTYTVQVSANGCLSAMSDPTTLLLTGIVSPGLEGEIIIAPNPISDRLTIIFKNSVRKMELNLLDIYGRVIYHVPSFAGTYSLNCKNIPTGNYVVVVKDPKTKQQVYKLVVKN